MRYLTLSEVLELHRLVIEVTGGGAGARFGGRGIGCCPATNDVRW